MGKAQELKFWILIGLLIIFHLLNNYFWIRQDCESWNCDTVHHVNIAVFLQQELKGYFDIVAQHKSETSLFSIFLSPQKGPVNWPHLVHFAAALFSSKSSDILFNIRMLNMIYFAILIVSVYLLGRKIYSSSSGIIAACTISLYPAVFGLSRKFGLDFPLTAIICLIIYFLIMCNEFKNRFYSVLLGISLGLGMLIKGQCILFVIGPLVYLSIRGIRKNYVNIAIFSLLALGISLVWWHRIFSIEGVNCINDNLFSENALSRFQYRGRWQVLRAPIYYIPYIVSNISLLFFIMFSVGAIFFIRRIEKQSIVLLLWLSVSYFVVSLIPTKNERFIFPIFGAIALISSIGWLRAPFKRDRKVILISLFILIGIYQFFNVSWYTSYHFVGIDDWAHPPKKNNHRLVAEDFNRIIQQLQRGLEESDVALIEEPFFHSDTCVRFSYFLRMFSGKNNIYLSANGEYPIRTADYFLKNSDDYDFLIAFSEYPEKVNFEGLSFFADSTNNGLVIEAIDNFKKYNIIKTNLLLPEHIYIHLLAKNMNNIILDLNKE